MATHKVSIETYDNNSQARVDPRTILGRPTDTIHFSTSHTGVSPPTEIKVIITSGIVNELSDGPIVREITLQPNATYAVSISKDCQSPQIEYSVSVDFGDKRTPRPINDDDS